MEAVVSKGASVDGVSPPAAATAATAATAAAAASTLRAMDLTVVNEDLIERLVSQFHQTNHTKAEVPGARCSAVLLLGLAW